MDLRAKALEWAEGDLEVSDATFVRSLAREAESSEDARRKLEELFSGPLLFGTAGLRGLMGAGEHRMNRAVVVRATFGLLEVLIESVQDAKNRGLVIGRDARRMSDRFQEDVAEVALAMGVRVHFLPEPAPTPVVAFSVRHLNAAAGIVVTASHNPPDYNGYKVYWETGAQIIPPIDNAIQERIEKAPRASDVPRLSLAEGERLGLIQFRKDLETAYLETIGRLRFSDVDVASLRVAYSAMHGVGHRFVESALKQRGLVHFFSTPAQARPDGSFPTVEFPNPEETGALDLVLRHAKSNDADIALVNDPDADRLAACVKLKAGHYRILSGNEIGVLLGDYLLRRDRGGEGQLLVMNTVVSSRMLKVVARASGARHEDTLTGFKWIANEAMRLEETEGLRFLFGYEEALGYTVGTAVRDKDGVSAALVFAEMCADLRAEGKTVVDQLEFLQKTHGAFVSRQKSFSLPGAEGAKRIEAIMAQLRSREQKSFGEWDVAWTWDLLAQEKRSPDGTTLDIERWSGNVLVYGLEGGGQIAIRPSGTEPKIKFYFELVVSLGDPDREQKLDRLQVAVLQAASISDCGVVGL